MPRGRSKPVEGFPSRRAAIAAWWNDDVLTAEISRRLGVDRTTVYSAVYKMRKAGTFLKQRNEDGGPPAQADTRGIWTPQKLDRARRLFGKTMLYIAEALQVPAKELMEYGLKGVIPPMGEGQRVAQLLEHHAAAAESEPTREDDEADLAALDEEEDDGARELEIEYHVAGGDGLVGGGNDGGAGAPVVASAIANALRIAPRTGEPEAAEEEEAPAASAGAEPEPAAPGEKPRRYRLTDGAGRYVLAAPGKGMTLNRAMAWTGDAKEIEALFKQWPTLKELDPERVP